MNKLRHCAVFLAAIMGVSPPLICMGTGGYKNHRAVQPRR